MDSDGNPSSDFPQTWHQNSLPNYSQQNMQPNIQQIHPQNFVPIINPNSHPNYHQQYYHPLPYSLQHFQSNPQFLQQSPSQSYSIPNVQASQTFGEIEQSPISLDSHENVATQPEDDPPYSTQPSGSRRRGGRGGGRKSRGGRAPRGGGAQREDNDSPSEAEFPKSLPWSEEDDLLLVSAWLNTSKDTIRNTEQKSQTFWKRIRNYYNKEKDISKCRSWTSCKSKWTRINTNSHLFETEYRNAMSIKTSGQSETDVMNNAHDLYYKSTHTRFTEISCWEVLRHEKRWNAKYVEPSSGTGSSKRSRTESIEGDASGPDTPMSRYDEGGRIERPIGIQAAKRARAKGAASSSQLASDIELSQRLAETHLHASQQYAMAETKKADAKMMRIYWKLSCEENLNPKQEKMLRRLEKELGLE